MISTDGGFARSFQVAVHQGLDFSQIDSDLQRGVDQLLSHPAYREDGHIWMTGSGDSLFAAQSAIPGLQRWARLQATALSSIEFARYRSPLLTVPDMLWAISNSGSAARTREAVNLARDKQILTVGITGSASGPLATMADITLLRKVNEIPELDETSRGVFMNMVEFLAAFYAICFTGLKLGVARQSIAPDAADQILLDCKASISSIGSTAGAIEKQAAEVAQQLVALDTIWAIGAGPSFGTARYCAAKFHEQLPWNGIPEDLEEWAHLQYFLTPVWKERSTVIVLAPPGNSLDRAEELVEGIHDAGGRAVVVAHPSHGQFATAESVFRIPGFESEWLSPLTYHLPAQMLILYLSKSLGEQPYALRRADGGKLIRNGAILSNGRDLA